MKKQIYRKESFPYSYTWNSKNNKIYFTRCGYNLKQALYDIGSNITGEVLGEIIVTKTNSGLFEFRCGSDEYLDMDRFMELTNYCFSGQSFAVRDIQRGFDYIAKNLYNIAKLKYGKEFLG